MRAAPVPARDATYHERSARRRHCGGLAGAMPVLKRRLADGAQRKRPKTARGRITDKVDPSLKAECTSSVVDAIGRWIFAGFTVRATCCPGRTILPKGSECKLHVHT